MNDLSFDLNGDLNLQWTEGNAVLSTSVRRRLATHPTSYARVVRTATGTQEVGTNFGSTLRQYIAYSDTKLNEADINQTVTESLSYDSRISLKSVKLSGTTIQVLFTSASSPDILITSID